MTGMLPTFSSRVRRRYTKFRSIFIDSSDPWFIRMAKWLRYRGKVKMVMDRADQEPYLERFYLINLRPFCRIVIHRFWKSDDDGGLHDHPWRFAGSKILKGGYWEWIEGNEVPFWCDTSTPFRWFNGEYLHRVELENEGDEVWTLFIMGPRYRKWGFIPYDGNGEWVYWRDYLAKRSAKARS